MIETFNCPYCGAEIWRADALWPGPVTLGVDWSGGLEAGVAEAAAAGLRFRSGLIEERVVTHLKRRHPFRWRILRRRTRIRHLYARIP